MIKLVLIHTQIPELYNDRLEPPLGLLYIASYLKERFRGNIKIDVIDLTGAIDIKNFTKIPFGNYYGFSTYTTTYNRTLEIKQSLLKINPKARTIAGGPHASALSDEVAKDFDYVVIGEGELGIEKILRGTNTNIISAKPLSNLDMLPMPDYSLVDMNSYNRIVNGKKSFSIVSSRGCPYKCLFCNSVIMGAHRPTRFRTPKNVLAEIKILREQYGDIAFRFQDDIFGLNIEWMEQFTKLIEPLRITYRAFVRASQCASDGFTDLLVQGGCKHIAIGVESGSDEILKKMNKQQTVEQCLQGIKKARGSGLIVRGFFIVGFPGETWDTIQETVNFFQKAELDEFTIYPFIPYPGTPVFHFPEKYGVKNISSYYPKYFQIYGDCLSHFVYDLIYADRNELQAMKDYLELEFEKTNSIWSLNSNCYV